MSSLGRTPSPFLLTAADTDRSWIFILILLLAHILLLTVLGLFFWFHILRLNRPKLLPNRHWLIGLGVVEIPHSVRGMPASPVRPYFIFSAPVWYNVVNDICLILTFCLATLDYDRGG